MNNTLDFLFASEGELWAGRVSIYRICWLSLYAAGWFGLGPGTFSIMFPFLEREHGSESEGILRCASWRVEYNERRPHSALGYQTPSEYAGRKTNWFGGN